MNPKNKKDKINNKSNRNNAKENRVFKSLLIFALENDCNGVGNLESAGNDDGRSNFQIKWTISLFPGPHFLILKNQLLTPSKIADLPWCCKMWHLTIRSSPGWFWSLLSHQIFFNHTALDAHGTAQVPPRLQWAQWWSSFPSLPIVGRTRGCCPARLQGHIRQAVGIPLTPGSSYIYI